MLQRGLSRSNPLMGLSFWRTGIIAADALSGQFLWSGVSLRSWDVAADAATRPRDRTYFESWIRPDSFPSLHGGAADGQGVGPQAIIALA
jgi:hypothetical protein